MALSVTGYHRQLSSCTISEKADDPILRKFSDGRTDRWTDRQKEESDFIGLCPINVEPLTCFQRGFKFINKIPFIKKNVKQIQNERM